MELKRALILFASVVVVAAGIVAATSPQRPESPRRGRSGVSSGSANASPGPAPGRTVRLRLSARERGAPVRRIERGSAGTLSVSTAGPTQVSIPALGLAEPAEPGTPAVFDLFGDQPGRFAVRTKSVDGGKAKLVGYIRVEGR